LLHASFRPRLATTPLRFANPSPPSGWVKDFHLQAVDHARHTRKSPPKRGRPSSTGGAPVWRRRREDPGHSSMSPTATSSCEIGGLCSEELAASGASGQHGFRCGASFSGSAPGIEPMYELRRFRAGHHPADLCWRYRRHQVGAEMVTFGEWCSGVDASHRRVHAGLDQRWGFHDEDTHQPPGVAIAHAKMGHQYLIAARHLQVESSYLIPPLYGRARKHPSSRAISQLLHPGERREMPRDSNSNGTHR
jgi:hypothetical protein